MKSARNTPVTRDLLGNVQRCYEDSGMTVMEYDSDIDTPPPERRLRYLHPGSLRPKLVVLKPDRTFCTHSVGCGHPYGSSLLEKKGPYIVGDIDSLERGTQAGALDSPQCSPRWCIATVIAVMFVTLGVGLGIYFGFKMVEVTSKEGDKMFRGSFAVVYGDQFEDEFADTTSSAFKTKAAFYEDKLDTIFKNSVLKNAFLRSEVLAIDPTSSMSGLPNGLLVHFNLHIDLQKVDLDAGHLYLVLVAEMDRQGKIFGEIRIDHGSLEIEERRREYSLFSPGQKIAPPLPKPKSPGDVIIPTSTHLNTPFLTTSTSMSTTTIMTSRTTLPAYRQCQPIGVPFCANAYHNVTSFPNLLGHVTRYEVEDDLTTYRQIVDSQCYSHAHHFLCLLLQPSCFQNRLLTPCRQYCQEFRTKCTSWVPRYLLNKIRCEEFPVGNGDFEVCLPEPDCAAFLRAKGREEWICDGVEDCKDKSDEVNCGWCQHDHFQCGDRTCVAKNKRCDNNRDCANAADELNCLSLGTLQTTGPPTVSQYSLSSNGFLILRDHGDAAKVCTDTLNNTLVSGRRDVVLHNIGLTACELLNYEKLDFVRMRFDHQIEQSSFHIIDPLSTHVTFMRAPCISQHAVFMGCSHFSCGRRVSLKRDGEHPVPGKVRPSIAPDWPWQVSLHREGVHTCDGTLVADRWVLTSEACFQGQPKSRWTARLGTARLLTVSPHEQRRRVVGMARSPVEGSNLVLVHLSVPVNFTERIRPACFASRDDLTRTGRECVALGWDRKGEQLQERHVVMAEKQECDMVTLASRHSVCAVDTAEKDDACQGEEVTGGALLCLHGETWFVSGILNWRVACGVAKRPRLYDRVATSAAWIARTMDTLKTRG